MQNWKCVIYINMPVRRKKRRKKKTTMMNNPHWAHYGCVWEQYPMPTMLPCAKQAQFYD